MLAVAEEIIDKSFHACHLEFCIHCTLPACGYKQHISANVKSPILTLIHFVQYSGNFGWLFRQRLLAPYMCPGKLFGCASMHNTSETLELADAKVLTGVINLISALTMTSPNVFDEKGIY